MSKCDAGVEIPPYADCPKCGAGPSGPCWVGLQRDEAELKRLRDFAAWVETWVSNPAASYSTSALDGLFGMTRDRIAAISPANRTLENK